MVIEIISVGTELLMGQIVNTNAHYLGGQFALLGIDHYFEQTVGDNMDRLCSTIKIASNRSDVVILTGGLGPTEDDLTKIALAKQLGLKMVTDENTKSTIDSFFGRLGRQVTPNNYRQCDFPEGAKILKNNNGTAPGCMIENDGKHYIVLPGPPHEIKAMFEESVKPFLFERCGYALSSKMLKMIGIGESALEDKLKDLIDAQTNPTLATYAAVGECMLRITAKCRKGESADELIGPVLKEVSARLGDDIYSFDGETLPQVVANMLIRSNKTLSVAESITGGMICSELVAIAGASKFLLEGAVVYSNEAKERLGVKTETLCNFGAISRETAIEMARCIRLKSSADIGISSTGNAGPDASEDKEIGLCFIGISAEGFEDAFELKTGGSRQRARNLSMLWALNHIRLFLSK